MIELQKVRLGDICKFQNGYAFKSKDFIRDGQYNVVKIKEFKNGKIKFFEDTATIDLNIDKYENYSIFKGDVLFALTGDPVNKSNPLSWVGRVAIYKEDNVSLLNQRVCKVITEEDKIVKEYVYYYFRVFENFYSLAAKATGSASQANISTKTIADTEIMIPSIETQKKIVMLLSAIDDKIDNNNQINDNLEKQLQCYFSNCADTPDKTVMLSDVCELTSSKRVFARDYRVTGVPFYRGKEITLKSNGQAITDLLYISPEHYKMLKKQSGVPQYGDILITAVGTIGNCYLVQNEEFYFKDGNIIWIKKFSSPQINYYIYDYMQSVQFKNYLATITIGSTQQALTIVSLSKIKINLPSNEKLFNYYTFSKMAHDTIASNQAENNILSKIRDTLLPQLMSGELDVSGFKF